MDSRKKSILKTISWRIIAIIISITVVYIFTNSISLSLGIAITSNAVAMIVYYFHERSWNGYK